ncbi:ATP-binding protein [Jiella pelagia]|uniref:ATP-binding protein n=1 Tax=Jiella pelagia TaxID=2986949 RepID=A0ABY7C1W3_9HYPH|nr:ATP-binding protein [Jiella pelagia]WAP70072.1 ATP-binding protein [Jiella pelagia]
MAPDSRRVIAAIERVKRVYVSCGRDVLADKSFKTFMENVVAFRNGERDEGRFFFVTGESGAGKTQVVKRMLLQRPELQPEERPYGAHDPVASVLLQGPCSMKVLAQSILEASGYAMIRDMGEKMMWHMLPRQLHHRHILLIHIDETQHMVRLTESDHDRKELAKAIKSLTANPGWPISFVVSGLPRTTELARLDEQIARRGSFLPLPDVRLPGERKLVENIIGEARHVDRVADRLPVHGRHA